MSLALSTRKRAFLELWIAGALWGFGFVAARWGLESFGPFTLVTYRFLLVTIAGGLALAFVPALRRTTSWNDFLLCFLPGLWLSAMLVLQGIGLQYTSVARAGFLSALYVVWVPFFEQRGTVSRHHWVCVVAALVGAGLMCEVRWDASFNRGDLFVIACSVAATLHIFVIAKRVGRIESAFALNYFQSVWAGLFAAPFAIAMESDVSRPITSMAVVGVALLAFGATLIAFAVQVRAQKVLRASTVSLFFLLESPFAALFGWWFFDEAMGAPQWAGGILILLAAAYSLRASSEQPVHS